MRLIDLDDLKSAFDRDAVIAAVRNGFIGHWQGSWACPEPVQILLKGEDGALCGDCHVKSAQARDLPYFAIKIATGVYDNPVARGLPVNSGMVVLLSSETGRPVALIQDEGWLTAWRTAAAGALAASLLPVADDTRLGVVGTGFQAALQAEWICHHLDIGKVHVYGRSHAKAIDLCKRLTGVDLSCQVAPSARELCQACRIVVTTTPATSPVLADEDVPPGTSIIAMGSDSPGKQELHPAILGRATAIVVDDPQQCLAHGEFGAAVRAGTVGKDAAIPFGDLLTRSLPTFGKTDDVVVDLTGLGAQDLAIAAQFFRKLHV